MATKKKAGKGQLKGEVFLLLDNGKSVSAIITNTSVKEIRFKPFATLTRAS